MKKQWVTFLMIVVGMCTCPLEQSMELIVLPKNKKKYVSEQQYIELAGEVVVVTNESIAISSPLHATLALLQQLIATTQKQCLMTLQDYVDGQRDCFLKQLNKVQRTDCYEKLLECKHKIETCTQKMKKLQQHVESMHKELQQQFQELLQIESCKIQTE